MATKAEIRELYRRDNGGQVPPSVDRQLDKFQEDGNGIHTIDYSGLFIGAGLPERYLSVYEIVKGITEGIHKEYMDLGRTMYRSEDLLREIGSMGDLPGGE
jgi:hypothetical protein